MGIVIISNSIASFILHLSVNFKFFIFMLVNILAIIKHIIISKRIANLLFSIKIVHIYQHIKLKPTEFS